MLRKIATITGEAETVDVYRDVGWQEYRVRVRGSVAGSAYHTDDKADAMATAQYLAGMVNPALIESAR